MFGLSYFLPNDFPLGRKSGSSYNALLFSNFLHNASYSDIKTFLATFPTFWNNCYFCTLAACKISIGLLLTNFLKVFLALSKFSESENPASYLTLPLLKLYSASSSLGTGLKVWTVYLAFLLPLPKIRSERNIISLI